MSDTGRLVKTTNAVCTLGVVGRRCVRYEEQTPSAPPLNTGSANPPRTPSPPWIAGSGGSSSSGCGETTLIVWEEVEADGTTVRYGAHVPINLVSSGGGVSTPVGCPGASDVFRV